MASEHENEGGDYAGYHDQTWFLNWRKAHSLKEAHEILIECDIANIEASRVLVNAGVKWPAGISFDC
jgi:hypothetical protein